MYLDPSFATMAIQFVIAAFAAAGSILFVMRQKIAKLFKRNKKTETTEDKDTPA